jgi:hypothetical protein
MSFHEASLPLVALEFADDEEEGEEGVEEEEGEGNT